MPIHFSFHFPLKIFMLSALVGSTLWADQVVLTNGDVITGSVIKKDGATLTLKSEFLGEVTIPWTAVKDLKSDQELHVGLPGGQSASGKVATAAGNLEVAAPSGPRAVPLAEVTDIRNPAEQHNWERLQHPGILQLWAGHFDIGLAMARGNARTDTLTSAFDAARVTRHDQITMHFDEIYGTARANGVVSTIASAENGNWTYQRNLTPRFFVNTLNAYSHDAFLDLDLRFVAGGGAGVNAVKTDRAALSFMAGGDYERESFTGNVTRSSAEANFGDAFTYKLSNASSITQGLRVFTNLSDAGQYRFSFNLSAVTALKQWLAWQVSVNDQFLSNPLFGRQRNDLILSTGFRVSFAR
jgi:hypothetical protein